jgi:hypothetical protein
MDWQSVRYPKLSSHIFWTVVWSAAVSPPTANSIEDGEVRHSGWWAMGFVGFSMIIREERIGAAVIRPMSRSTPSSLLSFSSRLCHHERTYCTRQLLFLLCAFVVCPFRSYRPPRWINPCSVVCITPRIYPLAFRCSRRDADHYLGYWILAPIDCIPFLLDPLPVTALPVLHRP